MAIREIVKLNTDEETLRKHCRTVTRFDERLAQLMDDLAETMYRNDGAGLAAPQVGVLKRACVVDVDGGEGLIELINPQILETEGEVTVREGCLSLPGRAGRVVRPEKLRVQAQDRTGQPFEIEAEGFRAVAICHEMDHLDGILYIDKMIEEVPVAQG